MRLLADFAMCKLQGWLLSPSLFKLSVELKLARAKLFVNATDGPRTLKDW